MRTATAISLASAAALGLFGIFGLPPLLDQPILPAGILYCVTLPLLAIAPATIGYLFRSFSGLTQRTRWAYYIIAAGIGLFAFTQVEQVAIALLFTIFPSLIDSVSTLVTTALYVVPSVLGTVAFYIGVRRLTKLLSVKTIWLSIAAALAFGAVFAGLSLLLPRTPLEDAGDETFVTAVFAIMAFVCGVNVATALGAQAIRANIGSGYRNAMQWLGIGLWGISISNAQEIIFKGTDLIESDYVFYSLDMVPFLLTALAFMKAGHALLAATYSHPESNATYVDTVMYAADMVSSPRDIDPILDRMRAVTSRLDFSASSLSGEEKQELIAIYLQIEDYLETKEPIRSISRASLRERLPNEFQALLQTADKSSPKG